jgi:hypothetical protein
MTIVPRPANPAPSPEIGERAQLNSAARPDQIPGRRPLEDLKISPDSKPPTIQGHDGNRVIRQSEHRRLHPGVIAARISPGSGLCLASGPAARGAAPPCRGSGLTERPYRHRKRQLRVGCEFWHGTRVGRNLGGRIRREPSPTSPNRAELDHLTWPFAESPGRQVGCTHFALRGSSRP